MIVHNGTRPKLLLLLSFMGLGIAILSALEGHVAWLASLCGVFGEGCRETGLFTLLGISIGLWGIAYYAVLTLAVLFLRPAVFWLVMAGLGAEISFAWIMVSMKLVCIFCLLNVVVILLLVVLFLDRQRIWQAAATCLLVFVITNFMLVSKGPPEIQERATEQNASVVARVGDETITALDLESPLAGRIYGLRQEIYKLKRDSLEELIDRILVRKEAEKRGVTPQQLINSLSSDRDLVSDAEVDTYYKKNQSRWVNWRGTQEDLLSRIRNFLQNQKDRQQIIDRLKPLHDQYGVAIYLAEPPLPFSNVRVGDSPVWGDSAAPVTVVEFSDYLCPACRAAHSTTKKIREQYAGKIRWVFKNFPLDRHKGARKMAEAGYCAGEQGQFWEFQDLLFASPEKFDPDQVRMDAQKLGLDVNRFSQCFDSGRYASKVNQDISDGRQAGVNATPTFIINGRFKPGSITLEHFKQIIDGELNKNS